MMRTLSVRARILILIAAVFLPTACAAILGISRVYQRETDATYDRLQAITRAVSLIVDRELTSRAAIARTLGASPAIPQHNLQAFYDEASRAVAGTDNWVVLVSQTEQVVNTRYPFGEWPKERLKNAQPLITDDQVRYGGFTLGKQTGLPTIVVYARAGDREAPVEYNVAIGFRPAAFQNVLQQQLFPTGWIASIVDAKQAVVARLPDPDLWIGHETAGPFRDLVKNNPEGHADLKTLDGQEAVVFYSTSAVTGWVVSIGVPKTLLALGAHRATEELSIGALLAAILIMLAGAWAVRTIGGPIQQVEQMARELSAEHIPAPLPTGLVETDHVAQVLRDAALRFQHINSELERRVEEAVARATEAQTLLLQTQKHEAIGRLSGGVAHDFNNMLQTLSTALHVLGIVTTDERGKKMLDAANRAVGKAAQLVQQMLVFGRAQPLTPKVVEFSNFLIRSQELLTRALGNGIVVAASLAPDLRPLLVDETQLELALLNLAFNSRDAMPGGGNLSIEALNRDLEEGNPLELPPGRYVELRVVDSGEGVAPEELEKVFEPYFTTKPVGKGSGLGLAQVQSFVQQSGGRVSISSKVEHGTTVSMLLPAAQVGACEDGEPSRGDALADSTALEVLFVEDDVLAASVVRHALEQLGHHVTHASVAKDALAQLQLRRFDILFTDIVMPGDMSGLELALKVQQEWPDMAVVVATGYAAQSVPRDQVRLISKPYTIDTVRRAFAAAMNAGQSTLPVTGQT
jgi:signal transduction histidine kinase/ActR/RegA family two-component response regulator